MNQESWYVLIYLLPSPYRLCCAKYSSCKFLCSCLSVQKNKVLKYTTLPDLSSVYRTVSTLNTKSQEMCHARSYQTTSREEPPLPGSRTPRSFQSLYAWNAKAKPFEVLWRFWSGYDHGIFTRSWDVNPCKPYNNMVKSKDIRLDESNSSKKTESPGNFRTCFNICSSI